MTDTVFHFGDYELDPGRRELRCSGQAVELQPRVFDLLLYLVRNRDRAVDKDELQDALWGRVIVTEASLARAVMKARKAIGDDASAQTWIRTVHGHGYHFVGAVEAVTGTPAATMPAPTPATESRRPARWPVYALVLLAGLGALALWRMFAPAPVTGDLRIAVLPVQDPGATDERAWTRLGLMSLVSAELARDGELAVVEDGAVAGLAANLHWDGDPASESGLALRERLQRVYGATHVLRLELVPDGPMLRLNHSLAGPDGSLHRGTMVGDEPVALAMGAVQAVYGQLLGRSLLGSEAPVVSADPFNNEAFARGMDLSLEGRCAEAVQFFRVIVEQEPGLYAPRLELAACLRILGEPAEAESLLTALAEEQRALDHPVNLGHALMTLGVVYNRSGRLDEAGTAYDEALAAAGRANDHDLSGKVLHNLSILAEDRGQFAQAVEYLDRAVVAYQAAGREVMPGQVWSGYANIAMDQGELDRADDYLERALEAFRDIGDRRNEAMMLNNTGYLRRLQGRMDEAVEYHLASLAIREEIRDRVGVGRIHGQLAHVHNARGDHEAARASAAEAVAIARETRDRLFEATALATLAGAEKSLGERESARTHYRESRAVLAEIQDSMRMLQVDLLIARMDLEDGAVEAAGGIADATLAAARELDQVQPEVEAMQLQADVALAMGQPEAAVEVLGEALERVRTRGMSGKESAIGVALANLLMDLDRTAEATPLVGSLARLEPNADVLETRARLAWLAGDTGQAAAFMAQARELAGAAWSEEREATLQAYLATQ